MPDSNRRISCLRTANTGLTLQTMAVAPVTSSSSLPQQSSTRLGPPSDAAEMPLGTGEANFLPREPRPGNLGLQTYRLLLKAIRKEARDALREHTDTSVPIDSGGLNIQAFCAAVDCATRALERSVPCRAITVQGCQNEVCGVYEYHGIVNQTVSYKSSPAQTATLFNSTETTQKSDVLICSYELRCFRRVLPSDQLHTKLCLSVARYRPKNVWKLDDWVCERN